MYERIYNLLIETHVHDPSARNCKLCGDLAQRHYVGIKRAERGTKRAYKCTNQKCNFNWREQYKNMKTEKDIRHKDKNISDKDV